MGRALCVICRIRMQSGVRSAWAWHIAGWRDSTYFVGDTWRLEAAIVQFFSPGNIRPFIVVSVESLGSMSRYRHLLHCRTFVQGELLRWEWRFGWRRFASHPILRGRIKGEQKQVHESGCKDVRVEKRISPLRLKWRLLVGEGKAVRAAARTPTDAMRLDGWLAFSECRRRWRG